MLVRDNDPEPVLKDTMMNKEDELSSGMNLTDRNISIGAIEATERPDELQASSNLTSTGKLSPDSPDRKVKRKRRSPEKPWKKPADMPKRPLSAYNLFFRDERERILSTGSAGKKEEGEGGGEGGDEGGDDPAAGRATGKGKSKKQKKSTGIGFANLAKSIAAKWKDLDDDVRAPYENIAATEKKKYDELVAEWRIKQTAKKKAQAAAKKEEDNERKHQQQQQQHQQHAASYREPVVPNLFSSERSLGSFSDTSNPYPPEWFHSTEGSERDDRGMSRSAVPPVVDTSHGASYDRRSYDSSMASPGWHYMQDPSSSSYYYGSHHQQHGYEEAEPYSRYSSDTHRTGGGYSHGSFSPDITQSPVLPPHSGYRDYYHHTQQSIYQQQQQHPSSSAGRHTELSDLLRMPRAASLPVPRHPDISSQLHQQPEASHRRHHHLHQGHASSSHRRSGAGRDSSSSSRYLHHSRGSAGASSSSGGSASALPYHRSASLPASLPRPSPPPPPLGEMGGAVAMGGGSSRHRGIAGATSGMMLSHGGDDMVMHDSSYRSVSTAPASVAPTTGTTATSATAAEAGATGTTRLSVSDRGTSGMSSRRRLLYPSDQLGADTALPLQPPPTMPGQAPPPHPPHLQGQEAGSATAAPHEDVEAVETSLQSLTESLDEDAISFITSMKYS